MTRAEKVTEAQRLRAEGLKLREIGERMGCSRQTVSSYVNDPKLEKLRARKDSYRGTCELCGAKTDGSNGRDAAPSRCRECRNNRNAERNKRLRQMWEADEPTWYIAQELGMSERSVLAWVRQARQRNGEALPLRRLGGDAAERKARHRRMIALRREGYTNAEIAEAVGMASAESVCTAFSWMRAKGLDVPPPPRKRQVIP